MLTTKAYTDFNDEKFFVYISYMSKRVLKPIKQSEFNPKSGFKKGSEIN